MSDIVLKPTHEQQKIVEYNNQILKIQALAGTGKTTTICQKVIKLINKGIHGNEITIITFTRAAADDIRQKLERFIEDCDVQVSTIDSFANKCLKISKGVKYNDVLYEERLLDKSESAYLLARVLELDEEVRNRTVSEASVLFIDEAQDTDLDQWLIAKHFAAAGRTVIVVGDTNQSIYQWRGASKIYMERFNEICINAETMSLTQSFRTHDENLKFLNTILTYINSDATCFTMTGRHGPQPILCICEDQQTTDDYLIGQIQSLMEKGVCLHDIMIVGRTNEEIQNAHNCLFAFKIPTVVFNNTDPEYIPEKIPNHVTLLTIHKAKGLEADYVFCLNVNGYSFPNNKMSVEEDLCLFFVATSRAREHLCMLHTQNTNSRKNYVSRFLTKSMENGLIQVVDANGNQLQLSNVDISESKLRAPSRKSSIGCTELIKQPADNLHKARKNGMFYFHKDNCKSSYSGLKTKINHEKEHVIKQGRQPDIGCVFDILTTRILAQMLLAGANLQQVDSKISLVHGFLDRYLDGIEPDNDKEKKLHAMLNSNSEVKTAVIDSCLVYINDIEMPDFSTLYMFKCIWIVTAVTEILGGNQQMFIMLHNDIQHLELLYNHYGSTITDQRLYLQHIVQQFGWKKVMMHQKLEYKYRQSIPNREILIKGEYDLLINDDTLIDIKASQKDVDPAWFRQLLVYAIMLKLSDVPKKIKKIGIYNPLSCKYVEFALPSGQMKKWGVVFQQFVEHHMNIQPYDKPDFSSEPFRNIEKMYNIAKPFDLNDLDSDSDEDDWSMK